MKNILTLVGTKFRGEAVIKLVKGLKSGQPLLLEHEPQNPHDKWAIKVLAQMPDETVMIGYVKSSEAMIIAPQLVGVAPVAATLAYDGGQWPLIELDI